MMRKKRLLLISLLIALSYGIFSAVGSYGYCHGWWGKANSLMRALWLCKCSPEFERSLYPENVDVLVSACECAGGHRRVHPFENIFRQCVVPDVSQVPGGRLLQVGNELVDLYTYQRIPLNLPPNAKLAYWLTDDILVIGMMVAGNYQIYLYNATSQQMAEISNPLGDFELDIFLQQARTAEKIIISNDTYGGDQIFLVNVPNGYVEKNYSYDPYQIPDEYISHLSPTFEEILDSHQISYTRTLQRSSDSFYSLDGEWIAKSHGVYDVVNENLVDYNLPEWLGGWHARSTLSTFTDMRFSARIWRSDSKALVLWVGGSSWLSSPVYVVFELFPGAGIYLDFPQPILLFNLPQE
jgi:hypothetical protein